MTERIEGYRRLPTSSDPDMALREKLRINRKSTFHKKGNHAHPLSPDINDNNVHCTYNLALVLVSDCVFAPWKKRCQT